MYIIEKEIHLDAAHKIEGHESCGFIHGHRYRVIVTIAGKKLDKHGMLVDFGDLKSLLSKYDHCYLNEIINPTTAEYLSKLFFYEIQEYCDKLSHTPKVVEIKVWETPTSCATFREV